MMGRGYDIMNVTSGKLYVVDNNTYQKLRNWKLCNTEGNSTDAVMAGSPIPAGVLNAIW